MYGVEKMLERLKVRYFDDVGKAVGIRPGKIPQGKRFFPQKRHD